MVIVKSVQEYQSFPITDRLVIFGAGPLPRNGGKSSHNSIVACLKDAVSAGMLPSLVYVCPEAFGAVRPDYGSQAAAERFALDRADVILAWVDRSVSPGLTTNAELGERYKLPWCFIGGPEEGNRYLQTLVASVGREWMTDIAALVAQVATWVAKQSDVLTRTVPIPLGVYSTADFQSWLSTCRRKGHHLQDFQVLWAYGVGPAQRVTFAWAAQVAVFVDKENRMKTNEFVYSRKAMSSAVVIDHRGNKGDWTKSRVLVVGEFRSPAAGVVYTLPGGSSFEDTLKERGVISSEIHEEAGMEIPPEEFTYISKESVMGAHGNVWVNLWRVEKDLPAEVQGVYGNISETEITYPKVITVEEALRILPAMEVGLLMKGLRG